MPKTISITNRSVNSVNINIGVASPVNALHIGGADGSSYIKFTSDATGHTGSDGARIGLNSDDLRIINAEPSGHMLFQTAATERMRIDSSGNVKVNTGNLVIGTSGKGIDFSASADGTGTVTSEVLDDYEEGTWTPAASGGASSTFGSYIKIGSYVHCEGSLTFPSQTNSGTATVEGLPFTSNASNRGGGFIRYTNYTRGQIMPHIDANSTNIPLNEIIQGNSVSAITWTEISGKRVDFVLSYSV